MVVLGHGVLNLFVDAMTGDQPPEKASSYALNEGGFQIPLHVGLPNTNELLNSRSLDKNRRYSADGDTTADSIRLPCATLLLRIVRVPKETQGFPIPSSGYGPGSYDSSRCIPSPAEVRLMYTQTRRTPTVIKGYVIAFAR